MITMDDLTRRAFDGERRRTARRLTAVIADIREELLRVEDAIASGAPLAASRARQIVNLAGDAAGAAAALDTLIEWGNIFDTQNRDD